MLPANPLLNALAPAGPHLPVALLRQYAAGSLAPAAQHRVEAHTLACSRCADVLAGLLQTPASTTDQALAQLQQRLRRRGQPQPAARPMLRQRRWLAPQLAAAAALLLCLVAGGWWAWQQRHPGPALASTAIMESVQVPAAASPLATPLAKPSAVAPASTLTMAQVTVPPASHYASVPSRRPAPLSQPMAARAAVKEAAPAADMAGPADELPSAAPPLVAAAPAPAADTTSPRSRPAGSANKTMANADMGGRTNAKAMPALPPVAPRPVGGLPALRDKLRRGAAEFEPENEKPIAGSVQLRLTIGADGKIEKVKVLRGMRDDYDAEAERLVREAVPTWIPGLKDGKRAALEADLSVSF